MVKLNCYILWCLAFYKKRRLDLFNNGVSLPGVVFFAHEYDVKVGVVGDNIMKALM